MAFTPKLRFGPLLKHLRKQAGMTQRDLAAALGYSDSLISNLEKEQRQPDLSAVMQWFIPALGLQDDPQTAAQLLEQAALARGERPPTAIALQRTTRVVIQEELDPQPARLPLPPTALIGRTAEVKQLSNRLLGHGGRLLTLVGPPGVGKTTLALAVGIALQPFYADGAVFVPLAAVSDPALLAATLVSVLKLPDSSAKPPQIRLIEYLRRKELLLLLDNFEQLLIRPHPYGAPAPQAGEGAEQGNRSVGLLAELLAECAGLRLLVTSRERLHLRAEQRYKVPPLALAAAVELFVQRAQAVDSTFRLTDQNQPTLEAICERLDRLPLALELCAAQIELFAPTQLLAQLQARPLDLLVDGAHDLPPQHRTLRAAIDRSYQLLPEEEQMLLRSLGIFVGSFALSEVEQVSLSQSAPPTRPLLALLHALIHKSLLRSETTATGEQRFLLLETIREHALEQAHIHGEETALRARHYAAYLQRFRMGNRYLRGPEATLWFARLDLDQDNLRAALQWSLKTGRYEDAAWLLVVAEYFWAINGQRYETARWIAHLLPHRHTLAVVLRLPILVEFVVAGGRSGEFPAVDQYRAEIIELLPLCPSKQLQAVAWNFLARSHEDRVRAYTLARAASEAPDLGPEFGAVADADFVLAAIQVGYANALLYQGEVAQATRLATDSLCRFRRRGNHEFIAECLSQLGNYAWLRGDLSKAHAHLQEAMTIGTTHNFRLVAGEWQWLLGLVTLYAGHAQEARRLLVECLPLCHAIKNTFHLAQVYLGLAETALWAGELTQAAAWMDQSLTYHNAPQRITVAEVQRVFVAGRLATAQEQYVRAATLFGLAEAMHGQIHHIYQGPMVPLVDVALATVRAALDPFVFAEAFALGRQMSLTEAFATILAPVQATDGFTALTPK